MRHIPSAAASHRPSAPADRALLPPPPALRQAGILAARQRRRLEIRRARAAMGMPDLDAPFPGDEAHDPADPARPAGEEAASSSWA